MIYLDLSSKIIVKKDLVKAIELFVRAKYESNPHHTFSIFYFKEGGEPVIHENLDKVKIIKKTQEVKC